jgi:hypothetical protein
MVPYIHRARYRTSLCTWWLMGSVSISLVGRWAGIHSGCRLETYCIYHRRNPVYIFFFSFLSFTGLTIQVIAINRLCVRPTSSRIPSFVTFYITSRASVFFATRYQARFRKVGNIFGKNWEYTSDLGVSAGHRQAIQVLPRFYRGDCQIFSDQGLFYQIPPSAPIVDVASLTSSSCKEGRHGAVCAMCWFSVCSVSVCFTC